MSPLLDQAVADARKLTDAEQDAIAALILEEIEDDRQRQAALARSSGKLAALLEPTFRMPRLVFPEGFTDRD